MYPRKLSKKYSINQWDLTSVHQNGLHHSRDSNPTLNEGQKQEPAHGRSCRHWVDDWGSAARPARRLTPYSESTCVFEKRGERGWERRLSAVPTEWRLHAPLHMVTFPLIKLYTNHYLTFIWDLLPVFYFLSIFIVSPSYLSLTFIIT